MLDIIIYSDNMTTLRNNNKAINMALVNYECEYNIKTIINYDNLEITNIINNKNKKIFIIDVLKEDSCRFASIIREKDFTSIIILMNVLDDNYHIFLNKRLMVLDFITKNDKYLVRLKDDLNLAIKIIYGDETFSFKYNHMLYKIPYTSINYIEKEPSIKRCIIHTTDKEYYIISSIENITNKLDKRFLKTHQSCIININNISKLDLSNKIIMFKNGDYTSLLTDKIKKTLKKCIDC